MNESFILILSQKISVCARVTVKNSQDGIFCHDPKGVLATTPAPRIYFLVALCWIVQSPYQYMLGAMDEL